MANLGESNVHITTEADMDHAGTREAKDDASFGAGQHIISQGEAGDAFYVLKSGEVEVVVEGEGTIATLVGVDYFGEMGLLNDEPRGASVVAKSETVECLSLDRKTFEEHVGALSDIMARKLGW